MKSHNLPNDPITSQEFLPAAASPRTLPQVPRAKRPLWASSYKVLSSPYLLAGGCILLYIITFTGLAILRHASFNSSGFDLGIYDQVVWNTLHGRPFFYTTTGQPLLHLSNHASPILLLVAPFYLLYSGPETLLFLQTAVVGLGGLPLFWLAREKLMSNFAALSLLLAYLLFPALQIVTLWDFHPPVLAVGFFMAAFYCLVKRKSGWFLFFSVLAMLCKEQLPLQVAFLGLYAILLYRDWRLGLTTITLAMVYFLMVMYWIIPSNSVTGDHLFIGFYADLGDSPAEIVITALTRPDLVIKNLWQPAKLQYLFDVLTPFAYLPVIGLPILAIGAPSFAINLLSGNTAMHDATGGQYGADVAPWLAWAALYGMVYLRQGLIRLWPKLPLSKILRAAEISHTRGEPQRSPAPGEAQRALGRPDDVGGSSQGPMAAGARFQRLISARPNVTQILAALLLIVALIWQLFRGYSPLALDPPHWQVTPHDRLAQRFIAQIPPQASIAAQGKLYPHLSNRTIAYQLPDVNDAEYVFFDATTGTWPVHPNDIWTLAQDLLRSGKYGVLDAADGYLLLQRGLAQSTPPDSFYDFARVSELAPQHPLQVDFGDELRLLGFDVLDDPRRGETAVRLYWQALRPVDRELRLYPFFVNAAGKVIEDTQQRPLLTQLWYPPRQWQPGQNVMAETMPWALGDRWSLAVGVLAGADWSDWSQRIPARVIAPSPPLRRFEANTWVRLATFERQGRQLTEIAPTEPTLQASNPLQVNFDGKIELHGYDVSQEGSNLSVTLYWQSLAVMPVDYTIFVHLLGPDGQTVAQHDGQPFWEVSLPTSTWQPGEMLLDRHVLPLPPDLPPGEYRLQVGVYYWQTLERLPVVENGIPVNDGVALGNVEIH